MQPTQPLGAMPEIDPQLAPQEEVAAPNEVVEASLDYAPLKHSGGYPKWQRSFADGAVSTVTVSSSSTNPVQFTIPNQVWYPARSVFKGLLNCPAQAQNTFNVLPVNYESFLNQITAYNAAGQLYYDVTYLQKYLRMSRIRSIDVTEYLTNPLESKLFPLAKIVDPRRPSIPYVGSQLANQNYQAPTAYQERNDNTPASDLQEPAEVLAGTLYQDTSANVAMYGSQTPVLVWSLCLKDIPDTFTAMDNAVFLGEPMRIALNFAPGNRCGWIETNTGVASTITAGNYTISNLCLYIAQEADPLVSDLVQAEWMKEDFAMPIPYPWMFKLSTTGQSMQQTFSQSLGFALLRCRTALFNYLEQGWCDGDCSNLAGAPGSATTYTAPTITAAAQTAAGAGAGVQRCQTLQTMLDSAVLQPAYINCFSGQITGTAVTTQAAGNSGFVGVPMVAEDWIYQQRLHAKTPIRSENEFSHNFCWTDEFAGQDEYSLVPRQLRKNLAAGVPMDMRSRIYTFSFTTNCTANQWMYLSAVFMKMIYRQNGSIDIRVS